MSNEYSGLLDETKRFLYRLRDILDGTDEVKDLNVPYLLAQLDKFEPLLEKLPSVLYVRSTDPEGAHYIGFSPKDTIPQQEGKFFDAGSRHFYFRRIIL